MQLYSTNNPTQRVDFKEAIFRGLPPDNGLYMPLDIPYLGDAFLRELPDMTFQEASFHIAQQIQKGAIPDEALREIIYKAIDFPAPIVSLDEQKGVLELFHGPSLAFKDFGARYMARTMSYFNQGENKELVILVATSGDTGGAVAFGFHNVPGIRVVILYPSGKVSHLQEQQLTTLGGNVTALEIKGTFDDCQALVKKAFLDASITNEIRLSSANSINIARLIPQSFYYFEAWKQGQQLSNLPLVFSVPSGNFGNLTAGLFAKKMGLPVHAFIAATNQNDIVPQYLETGVYAPRPSVQTLSNAMDVGNPSNFVRMQALYGSTWNNLKHDIYGGSVSDVETEDNMREIHQKYAYVIDPHGAVAYAILKQYQLQKANTPTFGVVLETAHPSKFLPDVERVLQTSVAVPARLAVLKDKQKQSYLMGIDFDSFKTWLLDNLK
jgi:threonine synthase